MISNASIQYTAYIENVKEVALFGTADLAVWREILKPEKLYPFDYQGKAGILISAPHLLWKGARFNELSISIAVSEREDGTTNDGYFLVHAFNSLRFFAFAERAFFQTPYYYADVQMMEQVPASFQVKQGGEILLEARMTGARTPVRHEGETFQGPIHLPGGGRASTRYFIARISGMTDFYPFSAGDVFSVHASTQEKVFAALRESNFTGVEWRIRGDAIHGKSKTYKRNSS